MDEDSSNSDDVSRVEDIDVSMLNSPSQKSRSGAKRGLSPRGYARPVSKLADIDIAMNDSPAKKSGSGAQRGSSPKGWASHDPLTPPSDHSTPCSPASKDATRLAKLQNSSEKLAKVAELKERWAREKEAKLVSMNERRSALQKFVSESSQKESEIRKLRVSMHKEDERKRQKIEKDLYESSAADRAHQAAELERIAKERRKHSLMLNKEMMRQFREKEAELEIAMKEEEAELLAGRRVDFLGARETRIAEDDRRRESLFCRGKVAQGQKEIAHLNEKAKLEEQIDMMDFRKALSANKTQHDKDDESCRREEYIMRGKEAQVHRNLDEQLSKARHEEDVDIIDFRRDLARHKAQKEQYESDERRQDFINRGDAANEERKIDQMIARERQDQQKDIIEFRREVALHKADRDRDYRKEIREDSFLNGVAAREDREVDHLLEKARHEENRDIFEYRRELATHKAQRDREEKLEEQQIMNSNREIAISDRRIDIQMEKERQDEDRDIINFRRDLAKHRAELLETERKQIKDNMILNREMAQSDRKVNQQSARSRQDEDRDVLNFRRELALHKAEKDREAKLLAQQDMIADGLAAQGGRKVDQQMDKARQDEDRDVLNFRRELALHKAEKDKEAREALKQQMISNGEVAVGDRKIDQMIALEKQDEHRDIMNFRRDMALNAAQVAANDKALNRADMYNRGEAAREDRKIDQLLGMKRMDEDRDIVNFRRELALAKAEKDKADGLEQNQILISNGLIAQENRKIDQLLEKARQDEDKDILHFRYETAVAKAAMDKANSDETKQNFIINGEMAQSDRKVNQQSARSRQDEDRDVLNFRRELALHKAEKDREAKLLAQQDMIADGLAAQGGRKVDQQMDKARQDEDRDVLNFRRELALHKAEKDKEAREALKQQMISNGEVAVGDRKIDQMIALEKQDEHRDIMNFRRDMALNAAQVAANDKALNRADMYNRGEAAREDRKIDQLLGMKRMDEDRDIVNFRRELALAKAEKDKADGLEQNQILISNGLIAQENRKIDQLLEKARQDEDKDILHFRYETAVAKAAMDKANSDETKQNFIINGEMAQSDRKVNQQSARSRQDEDRDVLNFRRELALHKAEKDREAKLLAQQDMIADGLAAQGGRKVDQQMDKARQDEDRDVLNFRRELALHKAEKDKEAREALKQQMISNGEVAVGDRKIDQMIALEKQDEHRDIMNFRRDMALNAAQVAANDKALNRADMYNRGEAAREDRKIDQLLGMKRMDEDRDIVNFRRELALAKAEKDKADGLEQNQILISNGLIAQENRKIDQLLEKARQDEDKDILHFRYETAVAKAAMDKANSDETKQNFIINGEMAQSDRKVNQQSARSRQDEDRDVLNFRRELALHKAEKDREAKLLAQQDMIADGLAAQGGRKVDQQMDKARQDEDRDVLNFRRELALHKAEKDKEAREALKQQMISNGEVAVGDRKIDQMIALEKQDEHRDIMNFRRDMALNAAQVAANDKALNRADMYNRGEAAREDRKIDQLLGMKRMDEDRDIVNFRRELALAKAEKDKADGLEQNQILISNGLIAQENRKIDQLLEKARQDEDKDILHFRYETAVAKAAMDKANSDETKQNFIINGEMAQSDRKVNQQSARSRQDEDRDVLNFRRELALHKAEKDREAKLLAQQDMIADGLAAQGGRKVDQQMDKARQDEDRDVLNFRRELALHKAEKDKEAREALKQQMISNGEVAVGDRKIDQMIALEKQDEHRDIMNFRRDMALNAAQVAANDKALNRADMYNRGEAAREDRKIDQLLGMKRMDEDRDIVNFRRELALAKAEKDKADGLEQNQILISNGLIAQENRKIDQLLEKARQDEDKDILHFRYETAVAKAAMDKANSDETKQNFIINGEMAQSDRKVNQQSARSRQDEDRDVLNFRRELALHKAEKDREAKLLAQQDMIADGLAAQGGRKVDQQMDKARQDEDRDVLNFRRELALHKAEKDKEAREALKQQMISNGEVAVGDRKIDQMIALEKQDEHRDIMNFRRDMALNAAQVAANDKALNRADMYNRGEAAREDRKIDQLLGMKRMDEDRDIVNFRRELALAKAEKDKADGLEQNQILISNGLIAQENRKIDQLLEKARQDEDKDILHFRYQTAVAKAAMDKANSDETKQNFIINGEMAQSDRKVNQQSARSRQDEDRDVLNFRRELALHKAEKDREAKLLAQQDMIADGLAAQGGRKVDQQMDKARQDEDRDVLNFRRELALHKAEKDKEAREALKQQMISNGEVAVGDRKIDQMIALEKQDEHRDIMNFRRDMALNAAQVAANDKALNRADMYNRGEAAREDRKIDQLLGMKRMDEDRDIVNFRRELALAKAEKDKADGLEQNQILISNGLIAQENRKIDQLLEKARQDEDKDILHFRYETAVAKAAMDKANSDETKQNFIINGEMAQSDRKVNQQSARSRQDEDRDVLNFRRELALHKAEKDREAKLLAQQDMIADGLAAQGGRKVDQQMDKARQDEDRDVLNFRRELALHKAEKDKEAREALKQQMISNGEVAVGDRKIDQMIALEKQDEHRDIMNFRRDMALNAAQVAANDKALNRADMYNRGEAAREDRKIDQLLGMKRMDEDRDIVNFRRELALAKAEKDKADGLEQNQILISNGLIAQENRKIDQLLEKARQDEDKDILHFRYQTAVAKAAMDKANSDETKQNFIITGEMAQSDRKVNQQSARSRQDEDRDVLNFRRELALHKAEKDREAKLLAQQDMIADGLAAQGGRKVDQQMDKARQDEDRDVLNFRRELALHKAEKDKEAREALKQQMISNGEVAVGDRKIDQMIALEKQDEHRDIMNFRRDMALNAAQVAANDKALNRADMYNRGEAAREDRKIDQLLGMKRMDEDRDIVNFRRELALAKAEKDKADGLEQNQILISNGLIAQENRKIDQLLEKARQDEDKDILHFRYETAVAKAAMDKANSDETKQNFIINGEMAQSDRKVNQQSARSRQDEDRDVLNFRRELALHKAEKDREAKLLAQQDMIADGLAAQGGRKVDQQMDKARQDEDRDVLNFRRELALHKAEKDKEAREALKQQMISNGEVAVGDRKIDQMIALEKQDEHRDIMNFRRDMALNAAQVAANDKALNRADMYNRGEAAREDRKIDQLLGMKRMDEDRDIVNFRRELALAKAEKDKADGLEQNQILISNGLIAQENRKIDQLLEKARQDEDKDILHFRYQTAVAKAAMDKANSDETKQNFIINGEMAQSDRKVNQQSARSRQDEDRDVLNFRRELALHKAEKDREAKLLAQQDMIADGLAAQGGRKVDQQMDKARQDEDRDVLNFRRELALHKAEKDKEAREALKQQMISNGEVAVGDRKIDQMIALEKQDEHRDIMNFRRDMALNAAQVAANDKALNRADMYNRGEAAREDRKIDQLLGMKRMDEDRDIVNFRRELALAKAEKDKADGLEQNQILISNGLIAQENRKIDQLLEKARQDEDKDILHFRYQTAVAKAAMDKANSDETKQNFIINGDMAQSDRKVNQQSARSRQDEDRDVLNFRRELALHKAEKDREAKLLAQQDMIADGLAAQGGRKVDQQMDKARQDEDRDVLNFRRELALHKAEKDKEAREALKQQMISNGEVAVGDRKIDQMIALEKQDEHRDIMNFRRDMALNAAQVAANDKALNRADMYNRGEAAREDRKIDQLLGMKRMDEDRDIVNFRRELALAKAEKDKADGLEQNQILISNGLIAQENRKIDQLLEKARQDEDKDILHFRYETAVAKAAMDKANSDETKQNFIINGEMAQSDRKVNQQSARSRQDEDRDVLNFRRELALHKAEKDREAKLLAQQDMIADGLAAQGGRKVDQQMDKARQDEDRDVLNFRRELALHKAEKDKEAREALKQQMISNGEVAVGDRKIDQMIALEKANEERDIMNFRREVALHVEAQSNLVVAERRITYLSRAEAAREDRKIDELLTKARMEEDIDALNFRRELALAKAEKDKADGLEQNQILISNGLIAQENRRIDQNMAKARQKEDINILNFRRMQAADRDEKKKADSEENRLILVGRGEAAQSDRKIDQLINQARNEEDRDIMKFRRELALAKAGKQKTDALEEHQILYNKGLVDEENRKIDMLVMKDRQEEDRNILNFRHEIALHKAARGKADSEEAKQGIIARGLTAIEDRKMDQLLAKTREEEDRDILKFRYELSLAKAAKEKADGVALNEILISNGKVAQKDRELDNIMTKQRQDEDSDILNFRRDLSKAKAAKDRADREDRKQEMVGRGKGSKEDRTTDLKMTLGRQEEDRDILAFRQELAMTRIAQGLEEAADNREDMFLKGAVARDDRKKDLILEKARQEEDRDILNFRRDTSNAEAAKKRTDAKVAREGLADRLNAWRATKLFDAEVQHEKEGIEKELLESRRQGWMDAAEDKKSEAQFKKESLNYRLGEWRRQKNLVHIEQAERTDALAYEQELKMQDIQDVQAYHESLKLTNRESLSFKLDKARKDKDYDNGMRALQSVVAEEERRIAEEDRADVANYRKGLVDARRESLIYRGQLEIQDRKRKEGNLQIQKANDAEERARRDEDWRSVKAAQEAQRAMARKELSEKLAYERSQRELEIQVHHRALAAIHEELQWRHCDWVDEQIELDIAADRKRKSTDVRLESWKMERMYEEKVRAQREIFEQEEGRLREQDREDLLYAKQMLEMAERMDRLQTPFIH